MSSFSYCLPEENHSVTYLAEDPIEKRTSVEVMWSKGQKIPKIPSAILHLEERVSSKKKASFEDYTPFVVSFGPYYHGKHELDQAESIKHQIFDIFVSESQESKDFFLEMFEVVGKEVRSLYLWEYTAGYSDKELAEMMLLDACFIIAVYSNVASNLSQYVIKLLGNVMFTLAQRDVLLLENQIPFELVKKLLISGRSMAYANYWIRFFICKAINVNFDMITGDIHDDADQPPFLLEALRRAVISGHWSKVFLITINKHHAELSYPNRMEDDDTCSPIIDHKIELGNQVKKYSYSFHSVIDLKAKGISFRPSHSDLLGDIKFTSFCFHGRLELPTFVASIKSRVWLKNAIAYELCPDSNTQLQLTSYIKFMKSIISDSKDVQELRDQRILINQLNNDDEVVELFKEINICSLDDDLFDFKVKEQIQKHYNSKAKTWMAELIGTHF